MEQPWGGLFLVMQNVENAPLLCRQAIPLWLRYVDDTLTAVAATKTKLPDDFHDHLKEQNADIQFTKKIEKTENVFF